MAVSVLPPSVPETPEFRAARRWLALALAVLVLAGLFALAVVIGRMPPFDRFVTDPVFFKRCLVVHVNLALVTWFVAFLAALLFLAPAPRRAGPVARHAVHGAAAGVVLMMAGSLVPSGRPLLANYIPTIENPLFQLGQLLFACGVLASVATRRWWSWGGGDATGALVVPGASLAGLQAVAVALGLSGLTLGAAAVGSTPGQPPEVRYEFLVWGVGHVLQLVSVIGMVTVWMMLLTPVLGAPPVSRPTAAALFASLVLPWAMGPMFALAGTDSLAYRHGFTGLMRWCLFPVVVAFLALCATAVARAWRAGRLSTATLTDPRLTAFLVSVALTLLGFGLGAAIRGSNTMVPAHYHAAVGGVTVAFMAATYGLLPVFRIAIPSGWARAAAWQSPVYGLGMLIFASGFALAGAHGMGRKMYGAEQAARGLAESVGLALMGGGGLVAIVGGVMFLAIVVGSWWRAVRRSGHAAVPPQRSPVPDPPAVDRPPALTGRSWRSPHEVKS